MAKLASLPEIGKAAMLQVADLDGHDHLGQHVHVPPGVGCYHALIAQVPEHTEICQQLLALGVALGALHLCCMPWPPP